MARTCPMCGTAPCACGFLRFSSTVARGGALPGPPAPTPTMPPQREPEKKVRGEVIGFRSWGAHLLGEQAPPDIVLMSRGVGATAWEAGPNKARCVIGGVDHDSPHQSCECGFYGWHDARRAQLDSLTSTGEDGNLPGVPGAIKAWGRLEVHAAGFRAEYAQIVSLAIPEHIAILRPHLAEQLRHLARLFDARIVAMEDLELAAREFGDTVPEDARPKVEKHRAEVTLTLRGSMSTAQAMQHMATALRQMQSTSRASSRAFASGAASSLAAVAKGFEQAQRQRRSRRLWSTVFAGLALVNRRRLAKHRRSRSRRLGGGVDPLGLTGR